MGNFRTGNGLVPSGDKPSASTWPSVVIILLLSAGLNGLITLKNYLLLFKSEIHIMTIDKMQYLFFLSTPVTFFFERWPYAWRHVWQNICFLPGSWMTQGNSVSHPACQVRSRFVASYTRCVAHFSSSVFFLGGGLRWLHAIDIPPHLCLQASSGHRKLTQSGPRSYKVLVTISRHVWVPVHWGHACANVVVNGSYFRAVDWTSWVFKALEICEIRVNKPSYQRDLNI